MNNTQQLGGTRQSSPLENEMSYPLTNDEFLLIKDNLSTDKLSNWEALLLTTGITSLISGVVIWFNSSFEQHLFEGSKEITRLNFQSIIILIIYTVLALSSFIGYAISKNTKREIFKPIQRLNDKISKHLSITDQ
jgi:hypothetical protein